MPQLSAEAVDALVSIAEQPDEQTVLERLVEVARASTSAAGALALLVGADGQPALVAHRGTTGAEAAALRALLGPDGPLGGVLRGQTVQGVQRADLAGVPAEAALSGPGPAAVLGVPVTVGGRLLGGLCLARVGEDRAFAAPDRLLAQTAARQAGAALEAVRQRAAHEALLDAMGPLEARVGDHVDPEVESPVVRRLLVAAREVLGVDLVFLSRLGEGRQVFTDVDRAPDAPSELALVGGTDVQAWEGYCSRMLDGSIPSAVPDVAAHPVLGGLEVTSALQIGAYCGVPVHLPDGALHGTLCGLHGSTGAVPSGAQLEALRVLARLIGSRLAEEQAARARRQESVAAFAPLLDGRLRTTVLQPIVDLRTGAPAGVEALSRFRESTGAARRPDLVFLQARRLGLGVQLEQAAAVSALALLPQLPPGTYLSVNLSPQAAMHPASLELLRSALAQGGAGRLVLELTEHDQVADYDVLSTALRDLRGQGLRVAVDDTGAGFASLQHVLRLEPEVIKLDMAFVREVHRDPARRAVARAMVAFAEDLGAALVAEGVETAEDRAEMLRLGARFGQGYHLGRPQPPAQALLRPGAGAPASGSGPGSGRAAGPR